MHRHLFNHISQDVAQRNAYFRQKPDGLGVMGFHPRHKCVVAIKILGRGSIADDMDDSYAMGESTTLECVKEFTHTIVDVYEAEYLRPPNQSEVYQILQENEARGFLRMLGSINCMHWEWASRPVAYHGAYR
jgi:hypothetical protein